MDPLIHLLEKPTKSIFVAQVMKTGTIKRMITKTTTTKKTATQTSTKPMTTKTTTTMGGFLAPWEKPTSISISIAPRVESNDQKSQGAAASD